MICARFFNTPASWIPALGRGNDGNPPKLLQSPGDQNPLPLARGREVRSKSRGLPVSGNAGLEMKGDGVTLGNTLVGSYSVPCRDGSVLRCPMPQMKMILSP